MSANEPTTTYYTLDGSAPTTSSTIYSNPVTISDDTTLKFFSEDAAGNREATKTETYTIENSTGSETFRSIGPEDGFVGRFTADGRSVSVHKLGDKGMFNTDTYRTILSFDTGSLPDSAKIQSARLRVYRKSLSGSVGEIRVDVKDGTFGDSRLEWRDYDAAATITDVASLNVPASDRSYTEVSLPTGLAAINTTGRTQFRLKASTAADFKRDVLEIYGGESAYAPRLILGY